MSKFVSYSDSSRNQKSSSIIIFNTGNPSSIKATMCSSQKKVIMNTCKTLFFIRKEKLNEATNKCAIYLRITFETRTEVSLNLSVDPSKWDNQRQCVKGNSPEAKALNERLKVHEVNLQNIYTEMLRSGANITAKTIKDLFLGKTEPKKTVRYLFDFYLKQISNKVGTDFSKATLKKYEYCYKHLLNFIWKTKGKTDIALEQVDYLFIKEFQQYLREESEFKDQSGNIIIKKVNEHNSTLKYLKIFKTILKEGGAYNWLTANPFAVFKDKFKTVEQVYLTTEELKLIMNKEVNNETLSLVKDLFVFACFTGFSYSDCEKLVVEDVSIDAKGRSWIIIPRTKTKTPSKVLLMPVAEQIIKKYNQHPIVLNKGVLLPFLANQSHNKYLKKIAKLTGLSKPIATHVARRTFASVAINIGVPAETIILILGHTSFKYLHLYAKVNDDKIVDDLKEMKNAFAEYSYQTPPIPNLRIA